MLGILRRVFEFADWSRHHPTEPPPGDMIDASFDAQNTRIAELEQLVLKVLREDGTIQNEKVTLDALSPDFLANFDEKLKESIKAIAARVEIPAKNAVSAGDNALRDAERASIAAAQAESAQNEVAGLRSEAAARVDALKAQATALLAKIEAAEVELRDTVDAWEDAEGVAQAWSKASRDWAEHMPDTIPEESLTIMDISGDHWSAKWWANYADNAFGRLTDLYLGALPTPPLTDPNGNPLTVGAIYYNTTANQPYIWNGSAWVPMWAPQRSLMATLWYSAASGQTVFHTNLPDIYGNTYTMELTNGVDVHVDGLRKVIDQGQPQGEYTVDQGASTVTFELAPGLNALVAIDILAGYADLTAMSPASWKLQGLTFDGTATTFVLDTAPPGPDINISRSEELVVSHNDKILEPGVDYIASGDTITFAVAPAAGTDEWIVWNQPATPETNIEWDEINHKPTTFPPSPHSHDEYAIITHGSGAPSSGIGFQGDYYYDDVADLMYGPKSPVGAWPPMLQGFVDAVADGKQYSRKNNVWSEIVIPPVIIASDAPIDDTQYARKNAAWERIVINPSLPTKTQDAPPSSPGQGQFWWETDTGNLYIWYDDGTSAQWVQVNVFLNDEPVVSKAAVGEWTFNITTTAPPAAGQIRFDNAVQNSATKVYIYDVTATSTDTSTLLTLMLKTGAKLYIQDKDDSLKYKIFTIVTDGIDQGAYHEVGVLYDSGGADLIGQRVLLTVPGGGGGGAATYVGDAPPSNPIKGQLWWETDTGILWLYYDDGTSVQWVQVNGGAGGAIAQEPILFPGADMSMRSLANTIAINSKADGSGSNVVTVNNSGSIIAAAHLVSSLGVLRGSATQLMLGTLGPTGDNGNIFLRPKGYNDVTNQIIIANDGVITIPTAIQFPATQVPDSDPNALDDYEENVWTPTILFGGANAGMTYSSRNARYIKIGRLVWATFDITMSTKGTSTGAATIGGLPFPVDAVYGPGSISYYSAMTGLGGAPCVYAAASSSLCTLGYTTSTAMGSMNDTMFTATSRLIGSVIYQATN